MSTLGLLGAPAREAGLPGDGVVAAHVAGVIVEVPGLAQGEADDGGHRAGREQERGGRPRGRGDGQQPVGHQGQEVLGVGVVDQVDHVEHQPDGCDAGHRAGHPSAVVQGAHDTGDALTGVVEEAQVLLGSLEEADLLVVDAQARGPHHRPGERRVGGAGAAGVVSVDRVGAGTEAHSVRTVARAGSQGRAVPQPRRRVAGRRMPGRRRSALGPRPWRTAARNAGSCAPRATSASTLATAANREADPPAPPPAVRRQPSRGSWPRLATGTPGRVEGGRTGGPR